jgi:hypothetical protein
MNSKRLALLFVPFAVAIAAPVAAQIFQASGFATVNVAGLGNTTTVAGESRIPILPRDLTFDAPTSHLHVRATGHRGAVRELTIDVPSAHAGQRYDVAGNNAASLHIRMDTGTDLAAQSGHGNITITTLDAQHVAGTYEGTFNNGSVPVVVRGRFEANFPRQRGASAAPSASP